MSVTPSLPLLRRVPPGAWTALAWCASVTYPALSRDGDTAPRDGSAIALATVVALAACALLRRRPLTALAALLGASIAAAEAWRYGVQLTPVALLAVDVAFCRITADAPRRTAQAAAALVFGVLFGQLALLPELGGGLFHTGTTIGPADAGLLTALIAWLVGRSMRQAREHARSLADQSVARAVTAERLRIAREMHDTVAHSIGVVTLQAGAARRVIDSRPDRAREALTEIETAGRETLAGLRRMLGALREADQREADQREADARETGRSGRGEGVRPAGTVAPPSSYGPPGLADLDRLTATAASAGLRVEVRREGGHRDLLPETDLAAYRVIQEAVTNVMRHADVRGCRVLVDGRSADALVIEVTDRGRGRGTTPGGGYGLVGLRERVALLNGEFLAGPRPEGGFRVTARLPMTGGAR
ncbi:sensor histidine kinase [Kitasatospora sp. NPDC004240]